jgi:hypothetical protein
MQYPVLMFAVNNTMCGGDRCIPSAASPGNRCDSLMVRARLRRLTIPSYSEFATNGIGGTSNVVSTEARSVKTVTEARHSVSMTELFDWAVLFATRRPCTAKICRGSEELFRAVLRESFVYSWSRPNASCRCSTARRTCMTCACHPATAWRSLVAIGGHDYGERATAGGGTRGRSPGGVRRIQRRNGAPPAAS